MSAARNQPPILRAIAALQAGERDAAVACLHEELRTGAPTGDRWQSVDKLAQRIGEIDIALEASRRYAATQPTTLQRLLYYCGTLQHYGRTEEAEAQYARLPEQARNHPSVLHALGTMAGARGNFQKAEKLYRRAIAGEGFTPQSWFALAMIKKFDAGDPDIDAMERARPMLRGLERPVAARFLYGLAKAWADTGETQRAFAVYEEGAALRHMDEKVDLDAVEAFADGLIRDFTPDSLERLRPSGEQQSRSLFVNGLPRSGTTLVEQIVASHSRVADGGELNFVSNALIPTLAKDWPGALDYERRSTAAPDPWGHLARSYFDMLEMRFRTSELVVDKTLVQSHFMGLMMHMIPAARVVWMRRDPEDCAWSCFRTFFTSPVPWSWSLDDIGRFFRIEDKLYQHWSATFPDRILSVQYEDLAADPATWVPRVLEHFGLDHEEQIDRFHENPRNVMTASVQQVRSPISAKRIGQAKSYQPFMEPFRRAYCG